MESRSNNSNRRYDFMVHVADSCRPAWISYRWIGHVKIRHKNLNPRNRGWFKKCKPTHAFWWLPRLRPPAPFVCFSDKKHTSTSLIPPLIIISMHAGALGSLNENSSIYGTENSAFGLRRTRSSVKNNEQNSETPGLVHVSFRRRVLVFSFGHFFDR